MREVIYTGCTEMQKKWGSYSGDFSQLIIGQTYRIEKEVIHSMHTKVFLEGIDGSFNSVCFKPVEQNN